MLDVQPNLSTAFHPESDGQTERVNQTIEQYLRTFCDYLQTDWADLLPLAEHAYNSTHHASIGMSPFYANVGYHPRLALDLKATTVPSAREQLKRLKNIHELARENILKAQEKQAFWANKRRMDPPAFEPGDKVWLVRKHIKTDRPSSKLDAKRLGPFKIVESIGTRAFRLELPPSMKIHNVFHVSLLEEYHANPYPARVIQEPPPPVVDEDGAEYFIIERILDSRIPNRGALRNLEYFVHWEGYPVSDRSWIPASELKDDDPLVEDFHSRYPHKPGYTRIALRSRGTRA
jgi:hypothetical protein